MSTDGTDSADKRRFGTEALLNPNPARCGDRDNEYGSRDKKRLVSQIPASITANSVGDLRTASLLSRNHYPVNTK